MGYGSDRVYGHGYSKWDTIQEDVADMYIGQDEEEELEDEDIEDFDDEEFDLDEWEEM